MELFDEDLNTNKNTDNKRTTTIILAVIIFLIIMVSILIGVIVFLKSSTLVVKVNDVTNNSLKNILYIDDENPSTVYVPIRKVADFLGYDSYKGSYVTKSEEKNQCYVIEKENKREVAMFTLNSNKIYKVMPSQESNYEYFYIDEPVRPIDGELYTTIDGIEKAFNVDWEYDVEKKEMSIYTMPYLINAYSNYALNKGYDKISEDFTNQKAILKGMIVAEKGEESNNKQVGVINAETGAAILEAKYKDVKYLQHTSDFLVTNDNAKKGIISKDSNTKVPAQYDDIELMDYDAGLYDVTISKRHGVINFNGKTVINLDYETIGIDNSKFSENDIRSKYILAGNLIPVEYNKLWGFYDTKGKQITECKYSSLGYVAANAANNQGGYSLLVVPDYNVIVVENDKKYTVITTQGEEVWGFFFDSIYLSVSEGKTSYILQIDSNTYDLTEQLDGLGYGKNNKNNNTSSNQTTQTESSQQQSQEATEENSNQEQYNQEQDNQEQNNDEGNVNNGEETQNNYEENYENQNEENYQE